MISLKGDYLQSFFADDVRNTIFVVYDINRDDFLVNGSLGIYFTKRELVSLLSEIGLETVVVYPTNDEHCERPDFRFPIMGAKLSKGIQELENELMRHSPHELNLMEYSFTGGSKPE